METRFDNRWRSFVIFLFVIDLVIQPILADDDNDPHGGVPGEAVPTGLGAPWPMKKPTPSTVQDSVTMNTTEYELEKGGSHPERIVGGDVTRPGEWPWMAAIIDSSGLCGGTLITNRHVLSATHCFLSVHPSELEVRLGDYDIFTTDDVRHVQRRVSNVALAPGYDRRLKINDIAIVTMDAPVQFTRAVQPIDLPSRAQIYDGRMGTIIGWGCTIIGQKTPSTVLRRVAIPIIPNAECQAIVPLSKICVASPEKSVCEGDSGGPLMVNDGGRWIQIGVASTRSPIINGRLGPSTFTRITDYLPWIHQNIR